MNAEKTSYTYRYVGIPLGKTSPVPLESEWIYQNFRGPKQSIIDEVKRRAKEKGFIEIPPGAVDNRPEPINKDKDIAPPIFWRQGKMDFCAHYSIGNAFMAIGYKKLAKEIVSIAHKFNYRDTLYDDLCQRVQKHCKFLHPKKYKPGKLDILNDVSDYPTLVVLEGSDGSINHSVTVASGWIFDANWRLARRLTKENLDWCSSTTTETAQFHQVYFAIRFIEDPFKKNKIFKTKLTNILNT